MTAKTIEAAIQKGLTFGPLHKVDRRILKEVRSYIAEEMMKSCVSLDEHESVILHKFFYKLFGEKESSK